MPHMHDSLLSSVSSSHSNLLPTAITRLISALIWGIHGVLYGSRWPLQTAIFSRFLAFYAQILGFMRCLLCIRPAPTSAYEYILPLRGTSMRYIRERPAPICVYELPCALHPHLPSAYMRLRIII
ncbi:hypothetical protein R3P38DRAFT_3206725 [Favolaschia claudopus]|uniref:Uncharacterized protein n=1 Tax=Favolaschia claudopus TaxID=2862362 RepID=A0AAW0AKX0_9AGAR